MTKAELTQERIDNQKEQAQSFINSVNSGHFDAKAFAYTMANTHRTLQQSEMRLVIEFLKAMASHEYSDARNEASVNLAKRLVIAMEELPESERYLPYV